MVEPRRMASRPMVLLDPSFRDVDEILAKKDLRRLREFADVVWARSDPMPLGRAVRVLESADAVVTTDWRYGEAALANARNLRVICDVGGGWPNLSYRVCFARRIDVLSSAPAFGPQVAEMALALALAASREVVAGDMAMRNGRERWQHAGNRSTFLLHGKNVGFIGFGGLARALLPLLKPFRCPIGVYHPGATARMVEALGCTPMGLERLLETSQVIFVLAAPRLDNKKLLTRKKLQLIERGAVLVLMSRAHLVDFDALTDLVLKGRFKAAIDVFPDGPLPAAHPIRQAEGAVLSAHRAGSTREGLRRIGSDVVDDLEAIFRGLSPFRMQRAEPSYFGWRGGPIVEEAP